MKIALDAMSGDFAPHSTVEGAVLFTKEIAETEIILVGKEEVIREELKKYSYDKERIRIQNAKEIIEMTDHPVEAIRNKKDSSMNVALDLVKKGEADACVSSGNTGALLSASQLKLKRIISWIWWSYYEFSDSFQLFTITCFRTFSILSSTSPFVKVVSSFFLTFTLYK